MRNNKDRFTTAQTDLLLLLSDPNLPGDTASKASEAILSRLADASADVVRTSWDVLADIRHDPEYYLRGPLVPTNAELSRVTRIVSASSLACTIADRYSLSIRSAMAKINHGFAANTPELFDVAELLGQHFSPVWATLDCEIEDLSPDEIASGLGLTHVSGSTLLSISYDVATSSLHVPTVIDAALFPTFLVSNGSTHGIPRHWNWSANHWGLPSFVHRRDVVIRSPRLRMLGTVNVANANMGLFRSYIPPVSREVQAVLATILKKASAHAEIALFLEGQHDILSLRPHEFEVFLASLYQRQGFTTSVTPASCDGGFDVIAFSNAEMTEGILIQAKKTLQTVGIRIVRELIGARVLSGTKYQDFNMVVATTARFSRTAKKASQMLSSELSLVDYRDLVTLLSRYRGLGINDLVEETMALRTSVIFSGINERLVKTETDKEAN